ncbi:putative phosphoesterase [Bacillus phage vB_BspM_AgentSmith]|nr:putative phosphoesterase [Bacillus phage vB_BspM_AgentSmith]
MSKAKDVVLFHAQCTDGMFAAYAHYLCKGSRANTVYIPVGYTGLRDKSPSEVVESLLCNIEDIEKRDVYILDFSFDPVVLELMGKKVNSVLILDHHLSASKVYSDHYKEEAKNGILQLNITDNTRVFFDMNRSGAMIAFNYFFPDISTENVPTPFKWVQDRDLWKFEYGQTKEFAAGIRHHTAMLDFKKVGDLQVLHNLLEHELSKVMSTGTLLVTEREDRVNREKKNGYKQVWINGQRVAFINAPLDIASELGNSIVMDGRVGIAVIYVVAPGRSSDQREDLPTVLCSIRSHDDVDSLFFAKHFGGGGHAQSNGCAISLEQLNRFLTVKGNHTLVK